MPDSKSLKFLKLLNDYLKQCRHEMNYVEAKRSQDKYNELATHEMKK